MFMFDMGGVIMKYSNIDTINEIQKPDEKFKRIMEDLNIGKETIESVEKILDVNDPLKKDFNDMLCHRDITKSFGGLIEDEKFIKCLKILKNNGYMTALLTNNFFYDNTRIDTIIMEDLCYFDYVVESCRIRKMKPHKEFYDYALNLIQLPPEECIFIDDLKENCDGAEKVGIKSLHLKDGNSIEVLKEIELITGLCIL